MLRTVSWNGTELQVKDSHSKFWDNFEAGTWEADTLALLKDRVRPGMTFIDVGAWIGPTTLVAAALGAQVVAFEPHPESREIMKESVAASGFTDRVRIVPKAIWKEAGTRHLSFGAATSGSSLVRSGANANAVTVECEGPEFLRSLIDPGSTLMKIDVEGSEYDIFKQVADIAVPSRVNVLLSMHPHKAVNHKGKLSLTLRPWVAAKLMSRLWSLRGQASRFPHSWRVEQTGRYGYQLLGLSPTDFLTRGEIYLTH